MCRIEVGEFLSGDVHAVDVFGNHRVDDAASACRVPETMQNGCPEYLIYRL